MVNSIEQVDSYLERGANAIECDIQFVGDGTPVHAFHGIPCDCFRDCGKWTPIELYMQYIRNITTPESLKYNDKFVLIILDLKTDNLDEIKKFIAGQRLFDLLLEHLFNRGHVHTRVNVLLSIQRVSDEPLMTGFMDALNSMDLSHLNRHIGWDVSANEPLDVISTMYSKRAMYGNIWQSDGITNCVSFINPTDRLQATLHLRDNFRKPYMSKIYHWTIDLHFSIRNSLRLGVDGLITNYPERIASILNEDEFHDDIRLANYTDNPWTRYMTDKSMTGIKVNTNHLERLQFIYSLLVI
ncbi:unnamed protein product, partial [Oppiella nova]